LRITGKRYTREDPTSGCFLSGGRDPLRLLGVYMRDDRGGRAGCNRMLAGVGRATRDSYGDRQCYIEITWALPVVGVL